MGMDGDAVYTSYDLVRRAILGERARCVAVVEAMASDLHRQRDAAEHNGEEYWLLVAMAATMATAAAKIREGG